ncbi:hypothetical protein GSI_12333 [Ganoderma sinense ZZ0214-1]|uniref:BTB domain-containing protein n=1 Tax=Ganoderma sinense ZZ0214-1 TaxID=1077348 RepID=A0A2G8RYJ3_9APHY|nr:hypothetical protein GSI_12333 [Ganoderma sinense ZZ0214-1]
MALCTAQVPITISLPPSHVYLRYGLDVSSTPGGGRTFSLERDTASPLINTLGRILKDVRQTVEDDPEHFVTTFKLRHRTQSGPVCVHGDQSEAGTFTRSLGPSISRVSLSGVPTGAGWDPLTTADFDSTLDGTYALRYLRMLTSCARAVIHAASPRTLHRRLAAAHVSVVSVLSPPPPAQPDSDSESARCRIAEYVLDAIRHHKFALEFKPPEYRQKACEEAGVNVIEVYGPYGTVGPEPSHWGLCPPRIAAAFSPSRFQLQTMDETPPMKRACTSEGGNGPDSTQTASLQRDKTFWYDDGTIVVVAGNIEFRIYRGLLARYSPVFFDMLSFPQPPAAALSTNQSSDPDCPVVQLTDSPEDLRHVLCVFMAGESLKPLGGSSPSFHALSSWIRIGHKYQIDKLVDDGLAYLRHFYPRTLYDRKHSPRGVSRLVVPKDRPATISGKHAIGVVNLARLTERHDLLPLALLECCKLGADITQGLAREDGTREYLSPEDLGRCFAAKSQLVALNIEACLRIFASARVDYPSGGNEGDTCLHPEMCEGNLKEHRRAFIDYHIRSVSVDCLLAEDREKFCPLQYLCQNCAYYVDDLIEQEQRNLWRALPCLFNIVVEGWGV